MKKDKIIKKYFLEDENSNTSFDVVIPDRKREWMNANGGHAYRCLPLTIANSFGWEILNPISFVAIWNGDENYKGSIKFDFCFEEQDDPNFKKYKQKISSHFGNGIITFSYIGYLFKTTEDHNLFIKGPTNHFKHGAQALEAIVETDWLPYTFTLNWKITKPHDPVYFKKGEPLATIFPIPRNYIESFDAVEDTIINNQELHQENENWAKKRNDLKKEKNVNHSLYTRGVKSIETGELNENHQRSIKMCPFHKGENNVSS
jgi:hypothetical protein